MRITLTGASGFIGRRLVKRLQQAGHDLHLLGRAPRKGTPPGVKFSIWDGTQSDPPASAIEGQDAVVHLAGEPVAQRWSPAVKRLIRASRVDSTARLVEGIGKLANRPATLICASAIGYYGDRGDETLTESSKAGTGFLPEVCVEWEECAMRAKMHGLRVVTPRIGIVLGEGGGALAKMLPAFRMGVGGRIGSGEQWMSWIHADDLVRLIQFAIEERALRGAVNATAPNPVRNSEFTQALGRALRRPALLPIPLTVVKLLFGEMSEVMVASQRAMPREALSTGFRFDYPDVQPALQNVAAR